ncbi:hypothetical protein RJ55_01280 [Drechmeria coniospora]|nr:hypothetical protein RJ55_01280 [Drechmeria coniospora]
MSPLQPAQPPGKPPVMTSQQPSRDAQAFTTKRPLPTSLPLPPGSRPPTVARQSSAVTVPSESSTRTMYRSKPMPSVPAGSVTASAPRRHARVVSAAALPGQESTRRDASRLPPSSKLSRPPATGLPISTETAPQPAKRAPAHARARSSVAGTHPAAALPPPSRDSSGPTAIPRHGRSMSIDERKDSAPSKLGSLQARSRLHPASSTRQQQRSPVRHPASKPPTSTVLAPPSPSKLPANVAALVETSKLQAELLQLHLLHRDAAAVDARWRKSARRKLGDRFATLQDVSRHASAKEKSIVEMDNLAALRRWGAMGSGLEEKIQNLGDVIGGLWTLGEPGGRYARVASRFERWMDGVEAVDEARRRSPAALPQNEDLLFVEQLDAPWRDECASMSRLLETLRVQLRAIDDLGGDAGHGVTGDSSLERMLRGAASLVAGMLAELRAMEEMEQEALAMENEWVESMNLLVEEDDTPRAGAVWRTV